MKPYHQDKFVTLYHADCREILPTLEVGSVDLVLTDPPYKIKHVDGGGFAAASRFYRDGALDGLCDFDLSEYGPVLARFPQIVAFHSRDLILPWSKWCTEVLGNYDLHVWYKPNAIPFTCNTWKSDLEYIALGWTRKHHADCAQHVKSKGWIEPLMVSRVHPTQKPIGLMRKYIHVLSTKSVVDPFAGSGTTLVAAKLEGRKAIGIEIEERYCEIAARRLSQGVLEFNKTAI